MMIPRKIAVLVKAGLSVALTIVAISLLLWANGPAVSTPRPIETTAPNKTTESILQIDAPLYRTSVTGGYTIRSQHDEPMGVVLGDLVASEPQEQGGQLAITIAKMPDSGLRAVSDVILRRNAAERYTEITLDGAPSGSIVYESDNPYELTIFFPHGDRYGAVSLTFSKLQQDRYTLQMQELLRKWEWL